MNSLPVDCFLGADGEGHVFPGANLPFGFVQLGPDMVHGAQHGYRSDDPVLGFSHTKSSGTGGNMWGNLRLMPSLGGSRPRPLPSPLRAESARPGSYSAELVSGILVELTAGSDTGFSRFSFPAAGAAELHLDVTSAIAAGRQHSWQQRPLRTELALLGTGRPTGLAGVVEVAGGWNAGRYALHFRISWDAPCTGARIWVDEVAADSGGTVRAGADQTVGVSLGFPEASTVTVRTELALDDILTGAPIAVDRDSGFETARERAHRTWDEALGVLDVDGGTAGQRLLMGSALRNVYTSVKEVPAPRPAAAAPRYTDHFALWDTFRTVHPLLTLIQPDRQRDIVNSVIATSQDLGWTFDALLAGTPGLTQGGTHADVVVADAYLKGLTGIDYETALELMVRDAETESPDPMRYGRETAAYIEHDGWIPVDYTGSLDADHPGHGRVVSRSLEYNYDDFCIAQLADGLGRPELAARLRRRSRGWREVWDPQARSLRPRWRDGSFLEPYDRWLPAPWDRARTRGALDFGWFSTPFYENSPMNYCTFVPHDMTALVARCGGPSGFVPWLDELFDRPPEEGGFDPGNEPAFLAPWLYLHAGRPDLTADRVRHLLGHHFRPTRDGWPGNDDAGAMSGLYVFAALGLFPNAGQDLYYLTAPQFEEAEIRTGDDRSLRVVAPRVGHSQRYLQRIWLDDRPLERSWLRHDELVGTRTLRFELGADPSGMRDTELPPGGDA